MVVRYFAGIRDLTQADELEVELPPATLGQLLVELSDRYGAAFGRAVLDGDRLGAAVMVLVNGRNASLSGGAATPLSGTDEIAVFPPVGGG